jgi:hypothetical protein
MADGAMQAYIKKAASKDGMHKGKRMFCPLFIFLNEGNKCTEIHCHMKLQYSNMAGVQME